MAAIVQQPPAYGTDYQTNYGVEKGAFPIMQPPQPMEGVPSGLEYLNMLDSIKIEQQLDLLEVVSGCEMNNKYRICNANDQQFFFATETTDFCMRQCCGPLREFNMSIADNQDREILQLYRPLRCQGCCCCCCLQEMEIQCPAGNTIGVIEELWTFMKPKYVVKDVNRQEIFRIEGPICYCCPCQPIPFQIFTANTQEVVGNITKQWNGCAELIAGVNKFTLEFPPSMNVTQKAILLGSTFLIDFMYFEKKQGGNN